MIARRLFSLMMLTSSLAGCASVSQQEGPVIGATHSTRAERIRYIKQVVARVCPAPLNDNELERAAKFVLAHKADAEAVWITGRLDKMDVETRICRGVK
jgi:hypothetical protein